MFLIQKFSDWVDKRRGIRGDNLLPPPFHYFMVCQNPNQSQDRVLYALFLRYTSWVNLEYGVLRTVHLNENTYKIPECISKLAIIV